MRRYYWLAGIAVLAVASWIGWMNAHGRAADKAAVQVAAADEPAADDAAADSSTADSSTADSSTADSSTADKAAPDAASKAAHEEPELSADHLTVPNGSAEAVLAFINKVRAIKPPQGAEDLKPFVAKTRGAMLQAADKILAGKPEGKTRLAAIRTKIESLATLDHFTDDAKYGKELRDLIDGLQKDKQPDVAKLAAQYRLQFQIRDLMEGNGKPEDAQKIWNEVKAKLVAAPEDKGNIQMALTVAQALGYTDDTKLAAQAYRDLSGILSKSSDPQIAKIAKSFEGTIRRLSLPGHPIEIKGTLVDGKPFDPASLKGKVVLLDFWATWCGPCRAELPNVKENYKKYHDKGFEVVGVSLDDKHDVLEKFLADEKITWPIIFGGEGELSGWELPLATYYGVGSIPTTILTNKKGDVISLNARGKKLGELLAEQLGK